MCTLVRHDVTLYKIPVLSGCIAYNHYNYQYLDDSKYATVVQKNVDQNCTGSCGAAAGGVPCLNSGVCLAGSPPYCSCTAAYTGPTCSLPIVQPSPTPLPPSTNADFIVLFILLLLFLLTILGVVLLKGLLCAKKRPVPLLVNLEGKDNIMPYFDEGEMIFFFY